MDEIVGKRVLDDGDTEYKVKWSGTTARTAWKPTWEPSPTWPAVRKPSTTTRQYGS